MTGGFLDGNIFRGLAFRILLFLTLALLPFGLIAVYQTREIARQADFNAELSLIALTNQAANDERNTYLQAFGAAETLSAVVRRYGDDPQVCSDFMAEFQKSSDQYAFVGYINKNGIVQCGSIGSGMQLQNEEVQEFQRRITTTDDGAVSRQPVVVMSEPHYRNDRFAGFVALSVPHELISPEMIESLQRRPMDVVTFNAEGEIVRSKLTRDVVDSNLPANVSLKALVGQQPLVFSTMSTGGQERTYAVVPLVSGVAYSMSIWRPEEEQTSLTAALGIKAFLPVLMWLASLVVAFWSLNRLAIRHIRKLGRQMRHFAYNRRVPRTTLAPSVPRELVEIQKSFVRMAESIVRDEAALEDSLRDKNILLKEVHHRVKNNLQLISSIMNMQIRRAQTDDARRVLKRLQDRILSLAIVHKYLYQSDALDRVDAGVLMEEIIAQLLNLGLPSGKNVTIRQSYDKVDMDADDAAPLTLLVSEAVTNAMKYLGAPRDGRKPYLDISLRQLEDDVVVFRIANSTNGAQGTEGTGLGTQLINAFARQLNGEVSAEFENEEHVVELRFHLVEKDKSPFDF